MRARHPPTAAHTTHHTPQQPRWPYCNSKPPPPPPYFGPYKPLGLIAGGLTGLQHALAMAGGLVTPPILIGSLSPNPETRTCEYTR